LHPASGSDASEECPTSSWEGYFYIWNSSDKSLDFVFLSGRMNVSTRQLCLMFNTACFMMTQWERA